MRPSPAPGTRGRIVGRYSVSVLGSVRQLLKLRASWAGVRFGHLSINGGWGGIVSENATLKNNGLLCGK